MSAATQTPWAEHAFARLQAAGYRRGGARTAVVEALSRHDCAVTALELENELRRRKPAPARASIYRALEQLEQLGLLRRLEASRGVAGYERIEPDGEHHHHAICRECGRMIPFEDASLERAIDQVSRRMSFDAAEHEVTIRGRCDPPCLDPNDPQVPTQENARMRAVADLDPRAISLPPAGA